MSNNYTKSFISTLEQANDLARIKKHSIVSDAHFFVTALANQSNPLTSLLNVMGVNIASLHEEFMKEVDSYPTLGNPPTDISMSNELQNHVMQANGYANKFGDQFTSLECYLLAVVADNSSANKALRILKKTPQANEFTEKGIQNIIQFLRQGSKVTSQDDSKFASEEIKDMLSDITALAEQGKLDPVIGRHDEIIQAIQILLRRTKNNPIIIGKPGVGKTAIVEGLAQLIVSKQVPEPLQNARIYALDIGALFAGTQYRGQLEEKIKKMINAVKEDKNAILFIDEIHLIVSKNSNDPVDIANLLKPELSRGHIHCIGATTLDEYRQYIEKDTALARRFQKIMLDEPTVEETITILRGLKDRYSNHHRVQITDSAITSAALLSARYITDRTLPDKAIDLIDEAAAKISMEIASEPEVMIRIKNQISEKKMSEQVLQKEIAEASANNHDVNDAKKALDKLLADIAELEKEYASYQEILQAEKSRLHKESDLRSELERLRFEAEKATQEGNFARASELNYGEIPELEKQLAAIESSNSDSDYEFTLIRTNVTDKEISEIISQRTGIPLQKLQQSERERLLELEKRLAERVIGQSEAVTLVSNAVRRSHAQIQDDKKPIGSFLFLGTTGVGKTELAKALANQLFDDDEAIVRIDMSEYMESHSVARLIGAPPGYVGYEQGGVLTEAVRIKPYSIVLFDEIEKAHPEVFNIFLQILDNGQLTDSRGNNVNFRNTVIIMTSNIGSRQIMENKDADYDTLKAIAMKELMHNIKPEILNRIDDIVVFHPLEKEHMSMIADIQLNRLRKRLSYQEIGLELTEEAKDVLCEIGFEPEFGARPLKRAITQYIENPLARFLIAGQAPEGSTVIVDRNPEFKELADIFNDIAPLTFSVRRD